MSIWQEIDSLRKEVSRLEKLLSRQVAKTAAHPVLRLGDIISSSEKNDLRTYEIQERNVAAQTEHIFSDVYAVPGDPGPPDAEQPVMFYLDNEGKRYILPSAHRLVLVQDEGGNTGKRVEKDENGTVTVPPGSLTLPYVVADPDGFFHNNSPPVDTGRIYPGIYMVSTSGVQYYLIFLEGHGPEKKIFTSTFSLAGASSVTINLGVDGQGNVKSVELV